MIHARTLSCLALFLALAACAEPAQDAPAAAAAEEAPPPPPEEDVPQPFDIARIPVSDAPLGDFPYFRPPPGYHTTDKLSSTIERAVFPFWIGDRYVAVEGRVHQANLRADADTVFSSLEVEQHIDRMLREAGAQRIHAGVIPRASSAAVLTRDFTSRFGNGLCWPSEPVSVYVVHRTDRAIWVHACTYGGIGAAWVIAETDNVAPERAKQIGSGELRQRIDADGRVDVAIQFESDSDRMLSGSQRQISEIVAMLEADPSLALSVNGHTDDSGTASRNLELSEQRARTIVDALAGRGIDRSRLRAHGFGREQPVADNATAEGRARNRRVELERI